MSKDTYLNAALKAIVQAQRTDLRGHLFRKYQRQAVKFYLYLLEAK